MSLMYLFVALVGQIASESGQTCLVGQSQDVFVGTIVWKFPLPRGTLHLHVSHIAGLTRVLSRMIRGKYWVYCPNMSQSL